MEKKYLYILLIIYIFIISSCSLNNKEQDNKNTIKNNNENISLEDNKNTIKNDNENISLENDKNTEDIGNIEIIYPEKERFVVLETYGLAEIGYSYKSLKETRDESLVVIKGKVSKVSDAKYYGKDTTIGGSFITLKIDDVLYGKYDKDEIMFAIIGGYIKIDEYEYKNINNNYKDNKDLLNKYGIYDINEDKYDYYIFNRINDEIYPEEGKEYIVFLMDATGKNPRAQYMLTRDGYSVLEITDEGVLQNVETKNLNGIVNIGNIDTVINEIKN